MRFQNAISAALTIFFLGLFGLSLTGCPFLGSGACEDEKEFSLASGVYQAIDDRENEQEGYFRYNDGADEMQVTVDKENETVEIQYPDEPGNQNTETWAIENIEKTQGSPAAPTGDDESPSADTWSGDAYQPSSDTYQPSDDTESGDTYQPDTAG
jgi:hypothetical protein